MPFRPVVRRRDVAGRCTSLRVEGCVVGDADPVLSVVVERPCKALGVPPADKGGRTAVLDG